MKIKSVKNIVFLFIFLVSSCSQNMNNADLNLYKKANNADYKACLSDANYNIEKLDNINQDRISILQTDDTMIDFYNIDNDIDKGIRPLNVSKYTTEVSQTIIAAVLILGAIVLISDYRQKLEEEYNKKQNEIRNN